MTTRKQPLVASLEFVNYQHSLSVMQMVRLSKMMHVIKFKKVSKYLKTGLRNRPNKPLVEVQIMDKSNHEIENEFDKYKMIRAK